MTRTRITGRQPPKDLRPQALSQQPALYVRHAADLGCGVDESAAPGGESDSAPTTRTIPALNSTTIAVAPKDTAVVVRLRCAGGVSRVTAALSNDHIAGQKTSRAADGTVPPDNIGASAAKPPHAGR